jgi:hypothetical protein
MTSAVVDGVCGTDARRQGGGHDVDACSSFLGCSPKSRRNIVPRSLILVVGLPHCRRAIIAEPPGGWTIVTEELIAHSWGVSYRSPNEALDALKAYAEHASDE